MTHPCFYYYYLFYCAAGTPRGENNRPLGCFYPHTLSLQSFPSSAVTRVPLAVCCLSGNQQSCARRERDSCQWSLLVPLLGPGFTEGFGIHRKLHPCV